MLAAVRFGDVRAGRAAARGGVGQASRLRYGALRKLPNNTGNTGTCMSAVLGNFGQAWGRGGIWLLVCFVVHTARLPELRCAGYPTGTARGITRSIEGRAVM